MLITAAEGRPVSWQRSGHLTSQSRVSSRHLAQQLSWFELCSGPGSCWRIKCSGILAEMSDNYIHIDYDLNVLYIFVYWIFVSDWSRGYLSYVVLAQHGACLSSNILTAEEHNTQCAVCRVWRVPGECGQSLHYCHLIDPRYSALSEQHPQSFVVSIQLVLTLDRWTRRTRRTHRPRSQSMFRLPFILLWLVCPAE